jgi:hypothetical protein
MFRPIRVSGFKYEPVSRQSYFQHVPSLDTKWAIATVLVRALASQLFLLPSNFGDCTYLPGILSGAPSSINASIRSTAATSSLVSDTVLSIPSDGT